MNNPQVKQPTKMERPAAHMYANYPQKQPTVPIYPVPSSLAKLRHEYM